MTPNRLIALAATVFLILFMGSSALSAQSIQFASGSEEKRKPSLAEGEFPIGNYDIDWTDSSRSASESMPLVGRDLGCNIWVEGGDLLIYAQRSGCLSENGVFMKLGRVRVTLTPNPIQEGQPFAQRLDLESGSIEIAAGKEGENRSVLRLWVDVETSAIHLAINTTQAVSVLASYENWRTKDRELVDAGGRRERFTCFNLEGYPGKVIQRKDTISFKAAHITFVHRNPADPLVPRVLIEQQGLVESKGQIFNDLANRTFGGWLAGSNMSPAGTSSGTYCGTEFKAWSLKSEAPSRGHHLVLASHIAQTATFSEWSEGLLDPAKAIAGAEASRLRSARWWYAYWNRSYLSIDPKRSLKSDAPWRIGRNYQLFRYQLGGNVSGEYPTKFNGGNLSFDPVLVGARYAYSPDWRQWGGFVHTAQNQRLLYWPMLKSGDFDAILPQFELYRKGLPAALARVAKHFGHGGAVFTEYMNAPGLVLGAGWGWEGTRNRGRGQEIPFGDARAHGARGYNDLVEAGIQANQSCAYHYESQLEHAYMILEYHRFTNLDITQYLPFIKESVIFFDEHYRLRQKLRSGKELDANGRLVIYPSTACETYRGARNPTDILAGLHACIDSLLALDHSSVTAKERQRFTDIRSTIPPYPFSEVKGERILKPAESWRAVKNIELPQFYPLFPFNRYHLGDQEIETFRSTYSQAPSFKGMVQSWHQDGIFFARMGMTREAATYVLKKLKDSARRFPTFWGPGHDWVPDHNWGGSGMIALQEMALQTIGSEIRILPAWPKDWPVRFKLHAPQQTTVVLEYDGKEITRLIVIPESRRDDVVIPKSFALRK